MPNYAQVQAWPMSFQKSSDVHLSAAQSQNAA
jgi:hypothetical protein